MSPSSPPAGFGVLGDGVAHGKCPREVSGTRYDAGHCLSSFCHAEGTTKCSASALHPAELSPWGTGSSRASQPHVRDARQGSVPIPFSSPASSPPCLVRCQRKRAGGTGSDARPLREGQEAAQADFRKCEATHDTRCPTSGISAWHLSTSPLPAVTPSSPPPGTEHPPLGSPNPCPARWHNHGYPGATPAPWGYVLGSTNSQALFKGFYFSKYTAYLQV